ncbi:MAG: diaminopimelate epimerase [Sedimentisphaerales bacterium]|jgi:diaminopimelate epimerase|nr:diaminopimelate epimerase [Sedimentisphaerales bacterium]
MYFTKMHGLGNDYVFVNTFVEDLADPATTARLVSDRHFGIGSDGLVLIGPSRVADAKMRIFNADGSEAQMCGNGLRCVAKYVFEHGLARSRGPFGLPGQVPTYNASVAIETGRGVLTVGLDVDQNGKVRNVCVNMGQPIFDPEAIPIRASPSRSGGPVEVNIHARCLDLTGYCLSMGNPHVVFFVEDLASIDLASIGPQIEQMDLFPQRTNVHFVKVLDSRQLRIITWERGSGITLACGTGACACCVAAAATGRAERQVTTILPGGQLSIIWHKADDCVYMTGPAVEVFEGRWLG